MSGRVLSLREMSRGLGKGPGEAYAIRELLGHEDATLTLRPRDYSFSILVYNMALLVAPAPYKGTDRDGALSELVTRIGNDPPDIVGLCEVFADGERDQIRALLWHLYPHYLEGPDEADPESDGGLLLLSKHPIVASHGSIYRQCAGSDCFANKGLLFAHVQPATSLIGCNIFLSHTQNIEESGGQGALYAQLTHMGNAVRAFADPTAPTLIVGDLNIPAENSSHYAQLIRRLDNPVDLWIVRNPSGSGATFASANNFYDDAGDAPKEDSRLDYIFLQAGTQFIPLLDRIEVQKWTRSRRQISDHYGLRADFDGLLEVDARTDVPIYGVRAKLTGFRCIKTTSGLGSDEVSFSVSISNAYGIFAKSEAPVIGSVDAGEHHTIASMPVANLTGDPGTHVDVSIEGTEHDIFSNSTLGIRTLRFSRQCLMLAKKRGISRVFPYHTGSGGEYGVDCRIELV